MTMKNNKGFTLIELIMVTIILGILAAVAIPRYASTVVKAEEAAEDAVISSIRAGLETYAVEQLMENGRRSWPDNPWDALDKKPAGYDASDSDDADADLNNVTYTLQDTVDSVAIPTNDNKFQEVHYFCDPLGSGSPFAKIQFKIVMKSSNSAVVPEIKDFRAICST